MGRSPQLPGGCFCIRSQQANANKCLSAGKLARRICYYMYDKNGVLVMIPSGWATSGGYKAGNLCSLINCFSPQEKLEDEWEQRKERKGILCEINIDSLAVRVCAIAGGKIRTRQTVQAVFN
jgi:hypothetical protein